MLTACTSTGSGQAPAAQVTAPPAKAESTTTTPAQATIPSGPDGVGPSPSNAPDPTRDTALISAAYANEVDSARALIDAGADVNALDDTQQSAYLIATSEVGDDPHLLELTLAAGADVGAKDSYNGTGLIRAAERGFPRIVARLLETDIQVDHVNRLGWTALLEAVILGDGGDRHIETVRLLIDAGADVNLPDRNGVTPLDHAQRRGHEGVAAVLRAGGAA